MGLFDKLFGKKDMNDEIEEYNRRADASRTPGGSAGGVRYSMKKTTTTYGTGVPQQTRSSSVVLRQLSSGGYDKAQTLKVVDALTAELIACTEAKNSGAPMPPRTEVAMPSEVRFSGFNKQDVDAMVSELRETIERIRSGG